MSFVVFKWFLSGFVMALFGFFITWYNSDDIILEDIGWAILATVGGLISILFYIGALFYTNRDIILVSGRKK